MKSYIKMILYLIVIAAFIRFFPLLLMCSQSYVDVKNNSEKLGIDNSTLFYSEEPRTSLAEQELAMKLKSVYK